MCGILLHLSAHGHVELDSRDAATLSARGPDALLTRKIVVSAGATRWYLTFASSVLSLRGDNVQAQPVVDESSGSIFCWNGEAWLFDGNKVEGNDTLVLASHLFEIARNHSHNDQVILQLLNRIAGPYAFMLYDAQSSKLYFARDSLGRRSLLIRGDHDITSGLTISSVPLYDQLASREVETSCLHVIDLSHSYPSITVLSPSLPAPVINKNLPAEDDILSMIPSAIAIHDLIEKLTKSLQHRVEAIPTYMAISTTISPSRVAFLFSGGLDCTLLARLAHDILAYDQPIDLVNVAFENPRVVSARAAENVRAGRTQAADTYETCPDRVTGRSSFAELLQVCPHRLWRFVAINVPYAAFLEHRPTVVHLMQPHNTEMDLSITSALYFAARGQGMVTLSTDLDEFPQPYTTTARVLLSGLGADELFGGYARHAAAFSRAGYASLIDELDLDFQRIGTRNLGRDDRVISHWGRETRYPFLDEEFVAFALRLSAWEKCGFRPGMAVPKHFETTVAPEQMEDLCPEKMLLRCAMWQLGMKKGAAEKKRAIQFGARTAKMHGGKTKGTHIVTVHDSVNET